MMIIIMIIIMIIQESNQSTYAAITSFYTDVEEPQPRSRMSSKPMRPVLATVGVQTIESQVIASRQHQT